MNDQFLSKKANFFLQMVNHVITVRQKGVYSDVIVTSNGQNDDVTTFTETVKEIARKHAKSIFSSAKLAPQFTP
jgi:uncharacterized protein YabE (DUF348 family)